MTSMKDKEKKARNTASKAVNEPKGITLFEPLNQWVNKFQTAMENDNDTQLHLLKAELHSIFSQYKSQRNG